ncbi:hypothetical protein M9434_002231 [Picochlorum sp. BPE23]|nr:hypothetical protein M9434_002231 [Picochlorum sp. BPE23]
MASRIVGLVQSVQLKLKIEACTHGDDEPAPIYRMDEVLETVGRDAKNIDDAVDCIAQRLQYRSSNVKQKSLKLVKYIAQKGSPEFQRGLNRLAPVIRELTHYTCGPDPFKGDIPWKRVQQYAKEALDVIHHGGGDGGSSRSGMVGFGSDQQQSGLTPLSPPTSTAFGTTFSVGLKDIRDSAMEALGSGTSMGSRSMGRSSERPTIRHVAGTTETSPPSASRYTHEVKAVDRFCSRGSSMRVAPTVEECQTFASSVAGRDGTALAKAMEKNIQHGRWQESLRALCVLDVISKPDRQRHATDEAILSYFKGHPQALQQATRSAQERVRSKSISVLSHIGVVEEDQAKPSNGKENGGSLLLSLEETSSHGHDDRPAHHTEESTKQPDPCVLLDDMSSLLLDDDTAVQQQNEQAVPNSPVAGLVSPSVSNTSGHVHSTTSDPFGDWTEPSPQSNPPLDMFSSQPPPMQEQNITDPFLSIENEAHATANAFLGEQNTAAAAAAEQTKATTTSTEDILNMFGSTTTPVLLTAPQANTTAQPSRSDSSSAWHAATSGFSSSQREDAAFDFVKSAMADVTKNQAMK